uniref:Uncharacterized protein n=1 Tax=Arundo donax TaxID=35708 RepID=A0A0A8ZVY4_ARUDO
MKTLKKRHKFLSFASTTAPMPAAAPSPRVNSVQPSPKICRTQQSWPPPKPRLQRRSAPFHAQI